MQIEVSLNDEVNLSIVECIQLQTKAMPSNRLQLSIANEF